MVVEFTNLSKNATGYEWDLGNGNKSTLVSPSAIYYLPGVYTVTLNAKDASGKTASLSVKIQVLKDPVASFSFAKKSACEGEIITFNEDAREGDTTIVKWSWDFGDGNIDTGRSLNHVYKSNGNFPVSLYVQDANGCSHDTVIKQAIKVWPLPIAQFNLEESKYCAVPAEVTFNNTSWRGNSPTYKWFFGDGKTSTDRYPVHTYQKTGSYSSTLIVTTKEGCKDTFNSNIKIEVYPLIADFSFPSFICGPDSVAFKNSTYPDASNVTYEWIVDGTPVSNRQHPNLYLTPGNHTVRLISSATGCYDEITKDVFVNPTPVGDMIIDPAVICKVPDSISFSFTPDTFQSYNWFVDGAPIGKGAVQTHIATEKKDLHVKLLVSHNGCVKEYEKVVLFSLPEFRLLRDTMGCVPLPVQFGIDDFSSYGMVKFEWDLGNGTKSTKRNPFVTYTDTGIYTVSVLATDRNGCSDVRSVKIRAGIKIKPNLTVDDSPVCNGDTVIFENLTDEIPVRPHRYIWIIGDSMTETPTKKNLRYAFHQMPGDKEIILETNHYGCKDSFIFDRYIKVLGPFSLPVMDGSRCAPVLTRFIDQSAEATSRTWLLDPVDGETDSIITKELQPGSYKVGLATYNENTGCRDTSYVTKTLSQKPLLSIEISGNISCPPVTSTIQVLAEYADSVFYDINGSTRSTISQNGEPVNQTFGNLPSSFDVFVRASSDNGCVADTSVSVMGEGPTARGDVKIEGTCFPYTLTLTDENFGKDTFEHYWFIGNMTKLPITSRVMTYILQDKVPGQDSVQIDLSVVKDSCYHGLTFMLPVDSRDVIMDLRMTESCETVSHNLLIKHSQPLPEKTWQLWGVNNEWDTAKTLNMSKVFTRPKNGLRDTLSVRVIYDDKCFTRFNYIVENPDKGLEAAFDIDTSGSACPPLFVNLIDRSTSREDIVLWEWDLGDGTTSTQKNPGKIYMEPGLYDITLVITNDKGCKDTSYHPEIVLIEGPKASVDIQPLLGCAPLEVTFKAFSNDNVDFKWDLGDGNISESQNLTHTYLMPGNYTPLLTISDKFGCKYTLPPKNTITVLDYPEADFSAEDQCAETVAEFEFTGTDGGGELTRIEWDFGNGATAKGELFATQIYNDGGFFDVTLTVENEGGCADSITKTIRMFDAEPLFLQSKPGVCLDEPVTLKDISTADTTIVSRRWLFNGDSLDDTSKEVNIKGVEPGTLPIGLIIVTAAGCEYSRIDNLALIVSDTLPLEPAVIRRVSVVNDHVVEIKIEERDDRMLSEHSVWMQLPDGGLNKIATFGKDELLANIDVESTLHNVYCMTVKRESYCPTPYPDTPVVFHCTVELSAEGDGAYNHLEWTPYIGWDTVASYEIYTRKNNKAPYDYLATVPGDQLTYIDTTILCKDQSNYRIRALEEGGFNEYSHSDTAHATPEEGYPVFEPEVWRATVENDDFILLEWVTPVKSKVKLDYFEVFKNSPVNETGSTAEQAVTDGQSRIDQKVAVDDLSYLYQVRVTDTCGTTSPWSTVGKTILLKVGFDQEIMSPTLSWSKYAEWNEGVEKYLIERKTENGAFEVIAQTEGPDDTTFIDATAFEACNPAFCYRITAIRNQPANFPDSTHHVVSRSNVQCSPVESHLYAPNAFTMNGDGLNETFRPRGMYLKTYELQIYTRWGERLYTTNECFGGWDGTYQGSTCQSDTYMYIIHAIGTDLKPYHLSGTVHLLK